MGGERTVEAIPSGLVARHLHQYSQCPALTMSHAMLDDIRWLASVATFSYRLQSTARHEVISRIRSHDDSMTPRVGGELLHREKFVEEDLYCPAAIRFQQCNAQQHCHQHTCMQDVLATDYESFDSPSAFLQSACYFTVLCSLFYLTVPYYHKVLGIRKYSSHDVVHARSLPSFNHVIYGSC